MQPISKSQSPVALPQRRVLFKATLEQVNMDFRFKYSRNSAPNQQQSKGTKDIKHGNIIITFKDEPAQRKEVPADKSKPAKVPGALAVQMAQKVPSSANLNMDKNQRRSENVSRPAKSRRKQMNIKKGDLFKKINLENSLSEPQNQQESFKPRSQDEELKFRTQRNKRVGVYIKRALVQVSDSISRSQLLIKVLNNYKTQLLYIQDKDKRRKRFQCIRKRIYESISVFSTLGLLERHSERIKPTNKIKGLKIEDELAFRARKSALIEQMEKKKRRVEYLKQKYFDAVTRNRVLEALNQRNKSLSEVPCNLLMLPLKLIVVYRPGLQIRTRKSHKDNQFIDKVQIISKQFLHMVHPIDLFSMLRRILPLKPVQQNEITAEYMESVQKQDQFQQNVRIRQELTEKTKLRSLRRSKEVKIESIKQEHIYTESDEQIEKIQAKPIKRKHTIE